MLNKIVPYSTFQSRSDCSRLLFLCPAHEKKDMCLQNKYFICLIRANIYIFSCTRSILNHDGWQILWWCWVLYLCTCLSTNRLFYSFTPQDWPTLCQDWHISAGVLALIDRNFQGFGKELFTDAGKYVIHFGDEPAAAAEQVGFHRHLA